MGILFLKKLLYSDLISVVLTWRHHSTSHVEYVAGNFLTAAAAAAAAVAAAAAA